MVTVAILGGGISGLSCAYYLKTLGRSNIKYMFLVEKSSKFGGWIQTSRFEDGAIFEHGPRTLRVPSKGGYNALDLAERLDLHSSILPVKRDHPIAKTNFILANGKLNPMPQGLTALFSKPPFLSKPVYRYLLNELQTKPTVLDDESIYSFFQRRVGEDVAKYVMDPFCRGITAGDARELSVRSMFGPLFENEQKYGSFIKGFFKNRGISPVLEYRNCSLVKQAVGERWRMWSLKSGLYELIDTLACAIEEREFCDLIFNATCSHLNFKDNKAELTVDGEKIGVDHVFSCIPSDELANLLPEQTALSETLSSISFTDVAVVYLEYERNVINYEGFGFLTPSSEDSKVLGIVFDSNCFPMLNGLNHARLTCMLGGKWFREILGDPNSVSEEKILKIAIEEATKILDIKSSPARTKVVIQQKCIPQYVVGHYKKLEAAEKEIKTKNLSISLLGASYRGAGVPDCILNSKIEVHKYLKIQE